VVPEAGEAGVQADEWRETFEGESRGSVEYDAGVGQIDNSIAHRRDVAHAGSLLSPVRLKIEGYLLCRRGRGPGQSNQGYCYELLRLARCT